MGLAHHESEISRKKNLTHQDQLQLKTLLDKQKARAEAHEAEEV